MKHYFNFKNIQHERGMLIFASIMLMSFFVGISTLMIKITVAAKKTSTANITNLKQNTLGMSKLQTISDQITSIRNSADLSGKGINYVTTTNIKKGNSSAITQSIKIQTGIHNTDASTIKINVTATQPVTLINALQNTVGGYFVDLLSSIIKPTDPTKATYTLKISTYICDISGTITTLCAANSRISIANKIITIDRTCPIISGTQLTVASIPGTDFYNLNCTRICPTGKNVNATGGCS